MNGPKMIPSLSPVIPPPIETKDQAMAWCEEVVSQSEDARARCNIILPQGGEASAIGQQRAYQAFLMRHGYALGVVSAMMRIGQLSPVGYNMYINRIQATLLPTSMRK